MTNDKSIRCPFSKNQLEWFNDVYCDPDACGWKCRDYEKCNLHLSNNPGTQKKGWTRSRECGDMARVNIAYFKDEINDMVICDLCGRFTKNECEWCK